MEEGLVVLIKVEGDGWVRREGIHPRCAYRALGIFFPFVALYSRLRSNEPMVKKQQCFQVVQEIFV